MKERNYKVEANIIKKLGLFTYVVAIVVFVFFTIYSLGSMVGFLCGLAYGLILGSLGFICQIYAKKLEKQADMQSNSVLEDVEVPTETLFLLCRNENVNELNSRADIARMKLIASNHDMDEDEETLIELFKKGKKIVDESERKEKLKSLKEEESIIIEKSLRYINYVGRDKTIAMCQDEIAKQEEIIRECEERLENLRSGGNAYYKSYAQKESSWAVHGGIASGIAGGAAGVATAINIQQNNEKKRQFNQDLAGFTASVVADGIIKLGEIKSKAHKEIEFWEDRIKEANNNLIEELPVDFLMKKLRPELINIEKRETGSLFVTIKTQPTPGILIYDTVVAVVDGTIKAIIKSDGEKVGEVYFLLPYNGAWNLNRMTGICAGLLEDGDYDVEFESVNLWAVETKNEVRIPEPATAEEAEERRRQEAEQRRISAEKKERKKKQMEFSTKLPDYVINTLKIKGKLTMQELLDSTPDWAEISNARMFVVISGLMKSEQIDTILENDETYYFCSGK